MNRINWNVIQSCICLRFQNFQSCVFILYSFSIASAKHWPFGLSEQAPCVQPRRDDKLWTRVRSNVRGYVYVETDPGLLHKLLTQTRFGKIATWPLDKYHRVIKTVRNHQDKIIHRHPTPDKWTIMYILLYSTHFTFLYCILWDPSTFNVPSTSDSLRAWVLLVGDWEVLGILLLLAFDSFLGHKYIPLGTKKQGDASLAKWMDASFPGVCVLWQWQERHVGVTRCLTQISPFIELVFGGALQAKTVL